MTTMREYNEQESDRLFRSCEDLVGGKKERKTGDLEFLVLQLIAVEARSALCEALAAPPLEN